MLLAWLTRRILHFSPRTLWAFYGTPLSPLWATILDQAVVQIACQLLTRLEELDHFGLVKAVLHPKDIVIGRNRKGSHLYLS